MIFTCIGFNFIRTSKEKQKVILQAKIMCPGGLLYASCGSPICVLWYYFKHDVPSLKLMGNYKGI